MNKMIISAVTLRLLLGWFMFVDGIENVLNPSFTASGFLLGSKVFTSFYVWFAQPMNLWWVNPLNAWGITLIGVALLLGVGIRPAAWAGVILMILYYFPHYSTLPWVPNGFIVEDHLIYAAAFALIAFLPAAQRFSLSAAIQRTFLGRIPVLRVLI